MDSDLTGPHINIRFAGHALHAQIRVEKHWIESPYLVLFCALCDWEHRWRVGEDESVRAAEVAVLAVTGHQCPGTKEIT